ncbi:MAG: hypothetical protein ACYC9P_07600, partial [Rudaea sp.]
MLKRLVGIHAVWIPAIPAGMTQFNNRSCNKKRAQCALSLSGARADRYVLAVLVPMSHTRR